MTREAFIRKWLANRHKQYNEQCRDEMRDDLDVIQTEAYNQAIRDAAQNAEVKEKLSNPYDLHSNYYVVDEQSILKLLKK